MKLRLLCVLTLCIWLGQICAGNGEKITEPDIRDKVYDASEQFVNDFVTIEKQFQDNDFIQNFFLTTIPLAIRGIQTERNSKIDVNQVKAYSSKIDKSGVMQKIIFDHLRVSQIILSKQFSPELYNGIVNLVFACAFDCATTEEIQSALNYLYGIDAEATKISFLDSHNVPKLTSEDDCPRYVRISPTIDELNFLVDVKPKVKEDFLAIREQFPCNGYAGEPLNYFIKVLQRLGGVERKVSACMIKERPVDWNLTPYMRKDRIERFVKTTEALLSTRLPEETVRGINNFQRITIADTPIDEIEKSLEYVYDDVPKSECSTAESSTLKAD